MNRRSFIRSAGALVGLVAAAPVARVFDMGANVRAPLRPVTGLYGIDASTYDLRGIRFHDGMDDLLARVHEHAEWGARNESSADSLRAYWRQRQAEMLRAAERRERTVWGT